MMQRTLRNRGARHNMTVPLMAGREFAMQIVAHSLLVMLLTCCGANKRIEVAMISFGRQGYTLLVAPSADRDFAATDESTYART